MRWSDDDLRRRMGGRDGLVVVFNRPGASLARAEAVNILSHSCEVTEAFVGQVTDRGRPADALFVPGAPLADVRGAMEELGGMTEVSDVHHTAEVAHE